jgi:hypothetical protein
MLRAGIGGMLAQPDAMCGQLESSGPVDSDETISQALRGHRRGQKSETIKPFAERLTACFGEAPACVLVPVCFSAPVQRDYLTLVG